MRNAFLITAVLLSLATAAAAADQKKKDVQPQAQYTESTQMARNTIDRPADYASSTQSDSMPVTGEQSQTKRRRSNSEGDPQASQNHVEYGGAG